MTNKKNTKRALLTSVVALFLCFTMLLGTTYAWFTDSVASGSNVITAGNLDIKVEYTLDGENWNLLDGANDLFQKSLWEPGHTEVVALRITNEGSLALKYTATMNIVEETIGTNKAGEPIVLSEILQVTTVTHEVNQIGDILVDMIFNGSQNVDTSSTKPFKAASILGADKELMPGAAHYICITVDMPETVGNEANAKDKDSLPSIEFGINVLATQYAYEEDSFDNQYDAAATYMNKNADGAWEITNVGELLLFAKNVNLNGMTYEGETVVLANDIDLAGINWMGIGNADLDTYVGFKGTFDGQGHTISNMTINSNSWGKGFFGYVTSDVTVKNVKFDKANVVASDCAGVVVGYATKGTFENIVITNATVTGTVADGHIGGVAGCGYNASFVKCSVDNATITSGGSFAGGIVGYQCNNSKAITDCAVSNATITGYAAVGGIAGIFQTGANFAFTNNTVENVVLNKTRLDGNPTIGALVGSYSGVAETTLTGAVSNVTLNGSHIAYSAYNELYGSNYSGATNPNFDVTGVTVNGIVNNLAGAEKVTKIGTAADLKAALNNVTEDTVIQLTADIAGDFAVAQHPEARIVIDGNGHEFAGSLVVDGKSATITSAGIVIRNVVFKADSINADACIRLGDGTPATRYTCNVTVSNCTFDVPGAVGVKSYTGGDKNLIITGCTATANAHSLAQIAGADSVVVESCKVYSKNGANFNQSTNVTVVGSTFDVKGYAVRFGAGSGDSALVETYLIKDCAMKSACTDADDAVIVLRGTADYATLTIENTTIEGIREILNTATDANVIVK